jgi:chemotaxis receptor (MCP) glutamine deamidase CheD
MATHNSPDLKTLPKEYVGAGDYAIVRRTEGRMLAAILGTCVAVALYDREADIGGMAHFLLPAPNDPASAFQPMNYAEPGLGLLIEELLKAGAQKDRLAAAIAGGALFGPVSRRDIYLDVGGRTAEVAMGILATAGIRIEKAETGGLNGSILLLDLTTFTPDIQPILRWERTPRTIIAKPRPA